jgi:hypothetical protein
MDVFMDTVKFALAHVAHETDVDRATEAKRFDHGTMLALHTIIVALCKPVEDRHTVSFVMSPRASGGFREHRNLLEAPEGMAGWHHDPHAVLSDQLTESIHIIGHGGNPQVLLNQCGVGLAEGARHR